jgi:hypothetical protein
VLYARCAFCGAIVPLWCSGQFMPHMPSPVAASPMGAYCSMCGVLSPVFTCGFCWGRQLLALPGAPTPAPAVPGTSPQHAQVVHAKSGASDKVLNKLFEVGGEIGKEAVRAYFGQRQG